MAFRYHSGKLYFLLSFFSPSSLFIAAPILIAWLLGPAIAWWVSKPREAKAATLPAKAIQTLHLYARKTWAYFEDFVASEDNWLAPDNFQEQPITSLAHRTSPTNIGLALISNLAAYDFGYLSLKKLKERVANTFGTLSLLERYKGHFYNWYDTTTLLPLNPKYVSMVDSGNFFGCLLVLRQGLQELRQEPIFKPQQASGLQDALSVLKSYIDKKISRSC